MDDNPNNAMSGLKYILCQSKGSLTYISFWLGRAHERLPPHRYQPLRLELGEVKNLIS